MISTSELEIVASVQLVLVEASKLHLDDKFMRYEPTALEERVFKEDLTEVIKKGIKDFWTPKYNPSFEQNGKSICFAKGKKPATGKSFEWWEKNAKNFSRRNKSKLGKKSEYLALMGLIIKTLMESGWSVEKAWYAVCCESKKLMEYIMLENEKDYAEIKEIFKLCNLTTPKVVADDNNGYWVIGANYGLVYSNSLTYMKQELGNQALYDICTGWITHSR